MFSSKSKAEPVIPVSANKIDTIIGEKTRVEGTLHTQDTTRIDGRIKGEAISDGYLIIGENGYVEGDIRSENMCRAIFLCGSALRSPRTARSSVISRPSL